MAVTSTGSAAKTVAVMSILVYDIYQLYLRVIINTLTRVTSVDRGSRGLTSSCAVMLAAVSTGTRHQQLFWLYYRIKQLHVQSLLRSTKYVYSENK